jgi:hypothetical protein
MTRRSTLLLLLVMIVIGLGALHLWQAQDVPLATGLASKGTDAPGSTNSFWFGPRENLGASSAQWLSDARLLDIAKNTEDLHSLYELMRKRPEPQAKWIAVLAGGDCRETYLGSGGEIQETTDWNTFDNTVRMTIASEPAMAEAMKHKRLKALSDLKTRCAGFSRPNGLMTDVERSALIAVAAKGGVKDAVGVSSVNIELSEQNVHDSADAELQSGDPAEPLNAIFWMVMNAHNLRNEQLRKSDVRLLFASQTLVEINLNVEEPWWRRTSRLNICATEGECDLSLPEYYLKKYKLSEPELAAAKKLVPVLLAEVAKHDPKATFDWNLE